jgi:hypothetical protein
MTEIVRAWPRAVGEQIAQNAWPARLARDGTLHVATSSSAWAFELSQLEPKLRERLGEELGHAAPTARFAPGKLPEASLTAETRGTSERGQPSADERKRGERMAEQIEDESLRKIVAKAAAASLARRS